MKILQIISLVFGVLLTIFTIVNFRKGKMLNVPRSFPSFKLNLNRLENPVGFWWATISQVLIIGLLILFGLGII